MLKKFGVRVIYRKMRYFVAIRPYGVFYAFYRVSPECFGYTLVSCSDTLQKLTAQGVNNTYPDIYHMRILFG
jgi:hypothetical protein